MIQAAMIAAVALILSAGPAAVGTTGNDLLAKCRAHEKLVAAGDETTDGQMGVDAQYCRSYVRGYEDGLLAHSELVTCLPDGVTYIQVVAVVPKYLEENPAQLHRPRGDLVEEALQEAWPCN
jgi:hypothetical protein